MKKAFLIILIAAWFLPLVSFAADISFSSDKNNFIPNEDFFVQVFLDTRGAVINAVEGTIAFNPDILNLKEIRDGNSSINFWVEEPHSAVDGKIDFSGIATGGFSGSKQFLFGFVLQAKKIGNGSISFSNMQVLQNDGLGTKIETTESPFSFSVSEDSNGSVPEDLKIKDTSPPENFIPFIANNEAVFDGKYFVAFSTVDKGTGIDHYEVRESFWGWGGNYVTAESPYLLKDQTLKSKIYIKAVDKTGNVRIVEIGAQNKLVYFLQGLICGIILLVCIFVSQKIWQRFIH